MRTLSIAAAVLAAITVMACKREQVIEPQKSSSAAAPVIRTSGQVSYADIVDRVAPAVVTVRSERRARPPQQFPFFNDRSLRDFFGLRGGGQPQPRVQRGLGSGVVVSEDGYLLTNHHVIDGAQDIKVEFVSGQVQSAKLIGSDPPSDLAVLKIDGKFPVLPLGDSDQVRVGDVVLAVGNPLGIGQTVTAGIISAKGRSTGLSDGSFEDFLQTDAPINQGNSGGALVNTNGELIGINSQILSTSGGNIGIGFSIPSNMAREVRDQLVKSGRVRRGQLGVYSQEITQELASGLGLKDRNGVLVADVDPNGAAAKAGIRRGDVIRKVNGQEVNTPNSLRNRIAMTEPGSEVTLTIIRDGKEQEIKLRLGELRAAADSAEGPQEVALAQGGAGKLGVAVQPLTTDVARQLGLQGNVSGILIRDVDPAGLAAEAGIRPGDVIVEVNRQPVRSTADLQAVLSKGGRTLLLVNRQGRTSYVTVG